MSQTGNIAEDEPSVQGPGPGAPSEDTIWQALRRNKQPLDNWVSKIPVGLYLLHSTPDGRFALDYVSPRMAEILDVKVDTLLADARSIYQLIHPDDMASFIRMNLDGIEHRRPFNWTGRIVAPGSVKWVHVASSPEELENGDVLWYGIIDDITERKLAEATIVQNEIKYRSLFENMQEGYAYCQMLYENNDPVDFMYLDVNPKFEQLTGLQNIIGKKVSEVLPGGLEADAELFRIYDRVTKTGVPEKFEIYIQSLSMWAAISAYSPEKNHFAVMFDNITERRQAEEALRDMQRRESIGVLSSGIAHDFNNLLGTMMGNVSLAQAQLPEYHPAAKNMEKALSAMERAAELTQQILAYSGKGRFQNRTINLAEVVEEHVSLFSVSLPKNVRLVTHFPETPVYINGDPGQIEQVIMNLIINGGDAIGEKQGVVAIRLRAVTMAAEELAPYGRITNTSLSAGRYVLLEVKDNGSGMSQETIAKIFDPFFTTKFTGRGLGLSAVLGIIRGHEGGMVVESREGEGTTFRLILPAIAPPAPAVTPPTKTEELATAAAATILIIDDDPDVATMAREIQESKQYRAWVEVNPRLGVERYNAHRAEIGLVFVDLTMPEMSGKEVVEALQAINPAVKIIVTSGYFEEEVTKKIGTSIVSAFIQKPYRLQSLLNIVQSVLQ